MTPQSGAGASRPGLYALRCRAMGVDIMETDAIQLRAEHDAVLERVSSRASILHLAHAVVSGGVGALFLAAAGKLWWDFSEYHPEYYEIALGVSAIALAYAAVRLWLGLAASRRERVEVARLFTLRKALDLDVPGAMLPR